MTSTVVWSDHASLLFHGIASLYKTGSLSDLVIKCHDQEFKVQLKEDKDALKWMLIYSEKLWISRIISCHYWLQVHKFVLNLFTDYFTTVDGVWIRINTPASHMEMMLYFMYHGQVCSIQRHFHIRYAIEICCCLPQHCHTSE